MMSLLFIILAGVWPEEVSSQPAGSSECRGAGKRCLHPHAYWRGEEPVLPAACADVARGHSGCLSTQISHSGPGPEAD